MVTSAVPNMSLSQQIWNFGHNHKQNLVWLLIFSVGMIFVGLGFRDPWPADEPRFAQIAREMVESGQWFFPTRGGELYPDKPPVFMWSIALFYWLAGSISVAFLLPSALSGLATIFLVYDIAKRLWSPQVAMHAALLLLVSVQFTLQAKTAQIDAMVCCWITLGCYGLLRSLILNDGWRWYYMAWFFMGLGVITKGVGFLPLLMLIPYAALRFINRNSAQSSDNTMHGVGRFLLGPIVMLGAISLWFVPMLILVEHSQNPLFEMYRDNILFRQTVTRYADSWHHIKPFWYYIVSVVPVFWLPVSLLLPWMFKHWKQAFSELDSRIILPLSWVVLVLIFFSLSPGKRGVYILPALPMLALVSAPYLRRVLEKTLTQRVIWYLVMGLSTFLLVFGLAGAFGVEKVAKLGAKYEVDPWYFLITVGLAGWFSCAVWFKQMRFLSWATFIAALWVLYSTWGYVLLNPVKTPKAVLENVALYAPTDAEVALVDLSEQFLLFTPYQMTHFGYHTDNDEQIKAAWLWQAKATNRWVIIDFELIDQCFDADKAIHLGFAHRVDWVLLGKDARLQKCAQPKNPVPEYTFTP